MDREPLSALKPNAPRTPVSASSENAQAGPSTIASACSSGASCNSNSTRKPKPRLAPIFLAKRKTPADQENDALGAGRSGSATSKRVHRSSSSPTQPRASASASRSAPLVLDDSKDDDEEEDQQESGCIARRSQSIHAYFLPSTVNSYGHSKSREMAWNEKGKGRVAHDEVAEGCVWKRPRTRMGVTSGRHCRLKTRIMIPPPELYLDGMMSRIPYHPFLPPSTILLPSIHPPTGRPRELAPPLAVAFNHIAKRYTVEEARERGMRRMVGVAGEEGGVRIVDVDEEVGMHREEKGWWWRAHSNAIFDFQWSTDDNRVLTASGDLTSRVHALTTPTPTLIATLVGHTSSVKTSTFFDPLGSSADPSTSSSIVASAGRDGNILIYDIRCKGQDFSLGENGSRMDRRREGPRDRYRHGVDGFTAQANVDVIEPVMTLRGAHAEVRRSNSSRTSVRSVTSLLALKSMPGKLASGGSFDGVVKLWDLRFAAPTNRCPNPRPSYGEVGSLPDPTTSGPSPSRRPRSINAMVESPTTGDIFTLCGDSKVHTLRPSAALHYDEEDPDWLDAIQPGYFSDPNMLISSFYIRLSVSPDGRYLAAGSCKGGVMTWDTQCPTHSRGKGATRLYQEPRWDGRDKEVSAIDWGRDILAASSDDLTTRIWRKEPNAKEYKVGDAAQDWLGVVGAPA